MRDGKRALWLAGLAWGVFGVTNALAQPAGATTPAQNVEKAAVGDCSAWTLDGYRIGMRGDELVTVRSVTVHMPGQAQVIVPGKFSGVLALDATHRLEKWDVVYTTTDGDGVRAAMRGRYGEPTSDVSGELFDDGSNTVRQRRTIWWSSTCDVALLIYQDTSVRGTPVHSVHATLARASMLKHGFAEMKTLFK